MLVNEGLRLGLADMVDPRSMTIDIQQLMGAVSQDTAALGVVRIEIRGAEADPSVVRLKGKKERDEDMAWKVIFM